MTEGRDVGGDPTPQELAAIMAAVDHLLAEEAAQRAVPDAVLPSDWVLAARPRPFHAPLPADLYDAMGGWGTVGEGEDHHRH